MTELGFLGAGNMGSAIMRGICSSDMQISVSAYDKDTAKLEALSAFGVKPCESECELVKKVRLHTACGKAAGAWRSA